MDGTLAYYLGWFAFGGLIGWYGIAALARVARAAVCSVAKYRRRSLYHRVIQAGGLEFARVTLANYESTGQLPVGLVALLPAEWGRKEIHGFLLDELNRLEEEALRMR